MSGEDQERFEDYLELERYIEDMQEERSAHLPPGLTPEQARLYRMAALLHSASSGNQEPRPEFVAKLYARLQAEQNSEAEPEEPEPDVLTTPAQKQPRVSRPRRRIIPVSRRALLSGGAVAAASLVAGTSLGMAVQATKEPDAADIFPSPLPRSRGSQQPWLLAGVNTTWHYVTTLAQLKDQALQFSTEAITGYVILNENGPQSLGKVIAFSAACTHMGCIVQWQGSNRSFACPCHGGLFTDQGLPDASSPLPYLTALPRLRVKIEDDKIYVEVPANH